MGKKCLVIDRRSHIAGNIYTKKIEGIHVHVYDPHTFHTNDREVWEYVNRFDRFSCYTCMTLANYRGEMYSLPFIERLPVCFNHDNNYFNALYQEIPIGGYTGMIENMLRGIDVRLGTDYLEHREELDALAVQERNVFFGGRLGEYKYYDMDQVSGDCRRPPEILRGSKLGTEGGVMA